jgi:hypothetical protein
LFYTFDIAVFLQNNGFFKAGLVGRRDEPIDADSPETKSKPVELVSLPWAESGYLLAVLSLRRTGDDETFIR